MVELLSAALLAGLLGSLHCIGMCGAFAANCGRVRGGLPAWHAGRLLTYTILGALAGTLGRLLPGPAWLPGALAAVLLVWFALALAGIVPEPRIIPLRLTAAGSRAARTPGLGAQFVFGVVNGFLPCGMVYAALALAVAATHPLPGALAMLAFGLGTVPALSIAAYGVQRVLLGSRWRRRVFAGVTLALGLWTIWNRATMPTGSTAHQHHHMAPAASGPEIPPEH
ncbi:MAG TPA: sulfite exporter TauE/SafE family protein [Gemmatimonadales bacterium]|nr:sulfite exporter TauE/SafE family protein [Gemmatimonadales bacterium]